MNLEMVAFQDRLRDDVESTQLLVDARQLLTKARQKLAEVSAVLQAKTEGAVETALTGQVDTIVTKLARFEDYLPADTLGEKAEKDNVQGALNAVTAAIPLMGNLRSSMLDALPSEEDEERSLRDTLKQQVKSVVDDLTTVKGKLARLLVLRTPPSVPAHAVSLQTSAAGSTKKTGG